MNLWKTSWTDMLGEMKDAQKRDRAQAAFDHAVSILPAKHRLFVVVTPRNGALAPERPGVLATVQIQRRAMFGGWRVISTADAAEFQLPSGMVHESEVLQVGRYTGTKLTVMDFFTSKPCGGHPTADGNVEIHVSFEQDFGPSGDEMTLNCALAAQDLALEYREGHAGEVRPPYAQESN